MSQEEIHSHSDEVLEVTRVDEADVPAEIIARVRELHAQMGHVEGESGDEDAENEENESDQDQDTSGRDTPSDLISADDSETTEEEEAPPRRAKAKAKAQRREELLWDKLLTVGVPTCPDHHPMRFDIGSEYFEKPRKPKFNHKLAKAIYENKKLGIPKTTGECIEFSFVKVNDDFKTVPDVKTFKADANFMRHHSETIAMFSKVNDPEDPDSKEEEAPAPPSLFTDDPNKMHLRCSRRIFKLMLRLLYNPGAHNKFGIMLFRRDNLEELLALAGFLKVDAIPAMINGIFPSAYEVYAKVFNYYSAMVNSYHREVPLTRKEAETLPQLFHITPLGKFSVMSRTELIYVLDRHGLFDALVCIFKDMYALDCSPPCSDVLGAMGAMKHPKHSGKGGHTAMSAMINVLYDNVMQAKKEADGLKPYRPSRGGGHHH